MPDSSAITFQQRLDQFGHAYLVGDVPSVEELVVELTRMQKTGEANTVVGLEHAVDRAIEFVVAVAQIDGAKKNPACFINAHMLEYFTPGEYGSPIPNDEATIARRTKNRQEVGEVGFAILRITTATLLNGDETGESRAPHDRCRPWPDGHPTPKVASSPAFDEVTRIGGVLAANVGDSAAPFLAGATAEAWKAIAKSSEIGNAVVMMLADRIAGLPLPGEG